MPSFVFCYWCKLIYFHFQAARQMEFFIWTSKIWQLLVVSHLTVTMELLNWLELLSWKTNLCLNLCHVFLFFISSCKSFGRTMKLLHDCFCRISLLIWYLGFHLYALFLLHRLSGFARRMLKGATPSFI